MTQQQDQKGGVGQQIQGVADSARGLASNAKDAALDARDQGAQIARDARDAAADTYRQARDATGEQYRRALDAASETYDSVRSYAIDEAQELSERAREIGSVTAGYARRASANTGEFVSANAIPLTLIGAGIGLLAWNLRRTRRESELELAMYDDDFDEGLEGEYPIRERSTGAASRRLNGLVGNARGLADQAGQRVGEWTDTARETASHLAERATEGAQRIRSRVTDAASQVGQQAGELSHEARERMRVAGVRTRDFADENPLIVGAIAVAAGVGVGLLLPNTQPENRLLGQHRDRLLGDARHAIDDARTAFDDARGTVAKTASEIGKGAREAAQDIRNQVTDSRISH